MEKGKRIDQRRSHYLIDGLFPNFSSFELECILIETRMSTYLHKNLDGTN